MMKSDAAPGSNKIDAALYGISQIFAGGRLALL